MDNRVYNPKELTGLLGELEKQNSGNKDITKIKKMLQLKEALKSQHYSFIKSLLKERGGGNGKEAEALVYPSDRPKVLVFA